jgi:hypothetical protein
MPVGEPAKAWRSQVRTLAGGWEEVWVEVWEAVSEQSPAAH